MSRPQGTKIQAFAHIAHSHTHRHASAFTNTHGSAFAHTQKHALLLTFGLLAAATTAQGTLQMSDNFWSIYNRCFSAVAICLLLHKKCNSMPKDEMAHSRRCFQLRSRSYVLIVYTLSIVFLLSEWPALLVDMAQDEGIYSSLYSLLIDLLQLLPGVAVC